MADYDVYVLRDDFTRLAYLPNYHKLHFVKTCNAVGAFEIEFTDLDRSLLAVDRVIEIWRRTTGIPPLRVFSGLLRKWPDKVMSDGTHTISLVGADWNDLLERRIVAYKADTPQADKHGPADDLMKALVRENLGNLAEADRNLANYGFSVQTDVSAGPVVSKTMEWTTVLSSLKKLAEETGDSEVFFDIVHIGKDKLEFQTWIGQRGLDRTTGAGVCYFGLEHGNLAQPTLTHDHSKEKNYVYVSGKGKRDKIIIQEVVDSDLVGASVWSRCEIYERAPSELADETLQSIGDGVLADNAPVLSIKGSLLDTKAARMGRDWNFGDRVLVRHGDKYLSVVIGVLDLELDSKGREKIKVVLDASTGRRGWGSEITDLLRLIKSLRKKSDEPPGGEGFYLDFTGTKFDSVDKCHRAGLRFSDVDSPFQNQFTWHPHSGSWSHAAGLGWQPFSTTTSQGPAMLFPLAQGHEWELTVVIDLRDASLSTRSNTELAYISSSGQTGAFAYINTSNAAHKEVKTYLYTNDGDDTYTARHTGTTAASGQVDTLKLRIKNGCVAVYDQEDEEWHDYEAKGSGGKAYNAANAMLQIRKSTTVALDTVYVQSLRVSYTDRS